MGLPLKLEVQAVAFSTYFHSSFSSIKAGGGLEGLLLFPLSLALCRRDNYYPCTPWHWFSAAPHLCTHLICTQYVQELHLTSGTLNHLSSFARQAKTSEKTQRDFLGVLQFCISPNFGSICIKNATWARRFPFQQHTEAASQNIWMHIDVTMFKVAS